MFNVAIKSIFSRKLRLLLTTFSIVLGVSFVAGTYIFTDSINRTFSTLFDDVYAGIDVTVRPAASDDFTIEPAVDASLIDDLEQVEGVELVVPEVFVDAVLVDSNGEATGGFGPPTYLASWTDTSSLNVLLIKDGNGRPPAAADEIVIDVTTAENNNYGIGDTVTAQAEGASRDFELVGLASFGEADSLAGATLLVLDIDAAQEFAGFENEYSQINIKAQDGFSAEQVRDTIAASLDADLEVVTGAQQTQENQDDINEGLGFINTALLAFAGVSIFVGAFIIQNTFRIIIAQRSKELAMLRAIGATRLQIVRMVMLEALIIGLIASAIGIAAGIGISYTIRNLANAAGLGLPEGELALLSRTVIVSMVVGTGITVVSALLPALRASKVSPVEALRDNESSQKNKSLLKRGVAGAVISVLGGGLLSYGLVASVANPVYYVGAGVAVLFVGVSVVAPLLTAVFANVVGWPFARLRGLPGRLAQQNTKRTPRRTASTAAALMIGVSLVAFVSIFSSSIKATVDETILESLPADISIYAPDFVSGVSPDLTAELKGLDELQTVSAVSYVFDASFAGEDDLLGIGIEPDTFDEVVTLEPTGGSYDLLTNESVYVRSSFLEEKNLSIGDSVALQLTQDFTNDFLIVGSFERDFDSKYLFSREVYLQQFEKAPKDTGLFVNYANDVSREDAEAAFDAVKDKYPSAVALSGGELVEQTKSQIDSLLALFWGLLGFAILIAVLGIANTLALSIAERTRELGLLRAVGMAKRQVRTMVRVESVMISLFGATLGVIMGIFFAWAVLRSLESEGLTGFVLPVGQIVAYFVLAAIAGIVASIVPAFTAARVDVLDALNFE